MFLSQISVTSGTAFGNIVSSHQWNSLCYRHTHTVVCRGFDPPVRYFIATVLLCWHQQLLANNTMSPQYFSVYAILNITLNRAATALNLVFAMISNGLILHYLVIWCYIYFTDLQCLRLLPANPNPNKWHLSLIMPHFTAFAFLFLHLLLWLIHQLMWIPNPRVVGNFLPHMEHLKHRHSWDVGNDDAPKPLFLYPLLVLPSSDEDLNVCGIVSLGHGVADICGKIMLLYE